MEDSSRLGMRSKEENYIYMYAFWSVVLSNLYSFIKICYFSHLAWKLFLI